MKTISIISKGRDVQFTTKSVTIEGKEYLYTHISELRHSEDKRVYGFRCDDEVCMLPYEEKDAQLLKAIFSQVQQMHRKPAPPKAPKATEAATAAFSTGTVPVSEQAPQEELLSEQPPVGTFPQQETVEPAGFIQHPAEVLQPVEPVYEQEPADTLQEEASEAFREEPVEFIQEYEPDGVIPEQPEEIIYEEQPVEVIPEQPEDILDEAQTEEYIQEYEPEELIDEGQAAIPQEEITEQAPTDKKAERAARKEEKLRLKEQRKAEKEAAKRRKQEEKEEARKARKSKKTADAATDTEAPAEAVAPAEVPVEAVAPSGIPADTTTVTEVTAEAVAPTEVPASEDGSDAEETLSYADIDDRIEVGPKGERFKKSIIVFLIVLACLAIAAVVWYNFVGPATDPNMGINSPENSTEYNDIDDMINDLEE